MLSVQLNTNHQILKLMKKKSLRFIMPGGTLLMQVFLAGLFLLYILPESKAQTEIASIDGVYIERTHQADTTTSTDSCKMTSVEPYRVNCTEIVTGDVIAFDIPGFNDFMQENNKLLKNVILKIDAMELPEFPAYLESSESDVVRFRFVNRKLSNENRKLLYKLPGKADKEVLLGIKIDGTNTLYYNEPAHLYFKEIKQWGNLGWILIVAFFLFFILIIFNKSVIRDSISQFTEKGDVLKENKNSKDTIKVEKLRTCYSFSKSQFAFWTFIVLASFIYIWAFTGDLQSINNTALILLGITSATITTGSLISKSEENGTDASAEKKNSLIYFRTKAPGEKSNFFQDILSDANGISIHRLQAVVFNLIFGIAFFKSVMLDYSMPEFSETQLILLGLSNGTYAFLKTTENK